MKKLVSLIITALIAVTASAQISDGFYRLQCKQTGRYLTIRDNYVNKDVRSDKIYLQSLVTISGFDNIVNDPGSIAYLRKTSTGWAIEGQGFTTQGKLDLQITQVGDAYRLWATVSSQGMKFTLYLRDYEEEPGNSYITTNNECPNWEWYIVPLSGDNYFGLKGDVKVGNSYYTTIYSAFPFKLGSGMKAYAVNTLTESSCTLEDLGGIVPAKVPAVIACAGEAASANKVTPLTEAKDITANNYLKGVLFCYPVLISGKERRKSPYWNCVDYDAATMRILGEAEGKLSFITAGDDLKYMPANKAYLAVTAGSAAIIPTDGSTTAISRISSDSRSSRSSRGTFTLNGTRLPDNVTPQKGIYIQDGKKVVYK